jgi:hypothetical protein
MNANAADRTPEDAGDRLPEPSDQPPEEVVADVAQSSLAVGFGPTASDDYYRPPKPGIAHFVAWLAIAAALIILMNAEYAAVTAHVERLGPHDVRVRLPFPWLASSVRSLLSAAGLVGAWVLLRDKLRGAPGRLQPGHWLFLTLLAAYMFQTVRGLALLGQLTSTASYLSTALLLMSSAAPLALAVAWLLLAIRLQETLRWRLLMVTMTACATMWLLIGFFTTVVIRPPLHWLAPFRLMQDLAHVSSLVVLAVLAAASGMDVRDRCRRDWLHWLGVLTLGLLLGCSLLSWIPSIVRSWV